MSILTSLADLLCQEIFAKAVVRHALGRRSHRDRQPQERLMNTTSSQAIRPQVRVIGGPHIRYAESETA